MHLICNALRVFLATHSQSSRAQDRSSITEFQQKPGDEGQQHKGTGKPADNPKRFGHRTIAKKGIEIAVPKTNPARENDQEPSCTSKIKVYRRENCWRFIRR